LRQQHNSRSNYTDLELSPQHSSLARVTLPLLSVHNLCVQFPVRSGVLRRVTGSVNAVDGVGFHIDWGETLGLVGESGSGKTTVGRAVLRLISRASGRVVFDGVDVLSARGKKLRQLRRSMQIVFQDPGGSLNPRMTAGQIIAEPLEVHRSVRRPEIRGRVEELLDRCGLWRGAFNRYPHQFSGGQRQRVAIARALALNPKLIICDEPTSALDVSIQAQILNLLKDLQDQFKLSYLLISHDLAVVSHMCDRIAVMHQGRIVEEGPSQTLINAPQHSYTQTLLAAVR
jgi:oligopeptide transport system ATP-binding protein